MAGQTIGLTAMGVAMGIMGTGVFVQRQLGVVAAHTAGLQQVERMTYVALGVFVAAFVVAFAAEYVEQQRTEGGDAESA